MKLGVTGASGFLGGAIIKEAVKRGWKVVGFSRNLDTQIEGCTEIRQFSDVEVINLEGLDAVIHLAGESLFGLWTRDKKNKIRESRIQLTTDLVEVIRDMPRHTRPKVLVSASAVGYYGDRADVWQDEESDAGFGFLATVCRDWEAAAMEAGDLGVRVVCARLGIVLGRNGGPLEQMRRIFRTNFGGRLGNGKQWMSWIHVDDAAQAFIECVENSEIRGAVNVTTPRPEPNAVFTDALAGALNRKALLPVPKFFLKRAPGGMAELFLFSQRVDPVVLKAFGFKWDHEMLGNAFYDLLVEEKNEKEEEAGAPDSD